MCKSRIKQAIVAFLHKTSSFCTFFITNYAETIRFLIAGHKMLYFKEDAQFWLLWLCSIYEGQAWQVALIA